MQNIVPAPEKKAHAIPTMQAEPGLLLSSQDAEDALYALALAAPAYHAAQDNYHLVLDLSRNADTPVVRHFGAVQDKAGEAYWQARERLEAVLFQKARAIVAETLLLAGVTDEAKRLDVAEKVLPSVW